jgi:hydroxymethylglutaryl-CoA reductase
LHDEFIENTLTNFTICLSVHRFNAINVPLCAIPMAIEESSVVAAASKAAKFWLKQGGFKKPQVGYRKNRTGTLHL